MLQIIRVLQGFGELLATSPFVCHLRSPPCLRQANQCRGQERLSADGLLFASCPVCSSSHPLWIMFSFPTPADMLTEEQNELVESAAEMMYGLIHARNVLTSKGLAAMFEKYKSYDFGRCPRVYCCGQPCLPVGQSDISRSITLKIYCPKWEDIYYPRSKYQGIIFFLLQLQKLIALLKG